MQPQTLLCWNCGAANAADSQFCDQCAAPLHQPPANANTPASAQSAPPLPDYSTAPGPPGTSTPATWSDADPVFVPVPPTAARAGGRGPGFVLIGGALLALLIFLAVALFGLVTILAPPATPTPASTPDLAATVAAITNDQATRQAEQIIPTLTAIAAREDALAAQQTATAAAPLAQAATLTAGVPASATPIPSATPQPAPSATRPPPTSTLPAAQATVQAQEIAEATAIAAMQATAAAATATAGAP